MNSRDLHGPLNNGNIHHSASLDRRLESAAGLPPDEARRELEDAAREAREAPGYPLMQILCRTLADPGRLLIAALLKRNPGLSATEIQVALGTAQATTSHHLRVLKQAGLILDERDGKWTRYRLDNRYERLVP